MAAALVNGFLTDFGVLRDNNPAQRIDPQEIASEKVRVSTKLKQGGNAEVQSVNQSISHLETSVEAVVEDSGTLINLNQGANADINGEDQSTSHLDIKVEKTVVEDSGMLTSGYSHVPVDAGNSWSFLICTVLCCE